jgi:hypothetical protein
MGVTSGDPRAVCASRVTGRTSGVGVRGFEDRGNAGVKCASRGDGECRQVRRTAAEAARLLGAEPDVAPSSSNGSGDRSLAELIEHVSRVLGVERPSGERTLMGIDNGELCGLLEEHAQLGLASIDDALLERLTASTLVLVGGDPRKQRRVTIEELHRDGRRLLCAFTDRDAMQTRPGANVACAWAVPAPRVAEFALTMGYGGCVVDPGSAHEIVLGAPLLQRMKARLPSDRAQ